MYFARLYVYFIVIKDCCSVTVRNFYKIIERPVELMNPYLAACLANNTDQIIIITNPNRCNLQTFHQQFQKAIYSFNVDGLRYLEKYTNEKRHAYFLKTSAKFPSNNNFIFDEIDVDDVQRSLNILKNSTLWNPSGLFYIKSTDIKNTCGSAVLLFEITWRYNIINAIFMCRDSKNVIVHYTTDPISSNTNPLPKRLIKNIRSGTCPAPNFNNLTNLRNFPIKIAATMYSQRLVNNQGIVFERDIFHVIEKINDIVWQKLQANVNYEYFPLQSKGQIDGYTGNSTDITRRVLHGEFECEATDDYEHGLWKNEMNLFMQSGLCFVTRTEFASILEQLSKILPLKFSMFVVLLFLLAVVLFVYQLKTSCQKAIVDLIRIVVGAATILRPKSKSGQIVVICFVINVTIVSVTLQSQLKVLLAIEPTNYKVLDSPAALVEYDYDVHAAEYFRQYYSESPLDNRLKKVSNWESCFELMRVDETIACLDDCEVMRYSLQGNDEYRVSRDETFDRYNVQLFRDDSFAFEPFKKIYRWLFEHGIVEYLRDMDRSRFWKRYRREFKPISLGQLSFAFKFLFISQTIACFLFSIELLRWSNVNAVFTKMLKFVH